MSERVDSISLAENPCSVFLKPDLERTQTRYLYYQSFGGFFEVACTDVTNPWWQGDYAKVQFTYVPADHKAYKKQKTFIL